VAAVQEPDAVDLCGNAIKSLLSANRIYFGSGRYDLAPASQLTLKKIAKAVKQCGAVIIEVDGFTDNVGPPAYNKMLSEGRAEAVVDFLVAAGVEAAKLRAVGFGQERPITTNNTREGRRLNRRIEFSVSSK
jgi:outer membrane protein OmpA-like peptidoglycan-associated protein